MWFLILYFVSCDYIYTLCGIDGPVATIAPCFFLFCIPLAHCPAAVWLQCECRAGNLWFPIDFYYVLHFWCTFRKSTKKQHIIEVYGKPQVTHMKITGTLCYTCAVAKLQ